MRVGALLLLLIPAITVADQELARTKTIRMQEYTVDVPGGKGWTINRDKRAQSVIVEKTDKRKRTGAWIYVVPLDVSSTYATVHSERWLGDDIRLREHANMIALGVNTGMYKLENLKRFEVDTANKHGYVMRYQQVLPSHVSDGYLFVYFPPDFGEHQVAYKFLYSAIRDPSAPGEPDLAVLNFVIGSFNRTRAK